MSEACHKLTMNQTTPTKMMGILSQYTIFVKIDPKTNFSISVILFFDFVSPSEFGELLLFLTFENIHCKVNFSKSLE